MLLKANYMILIDLRLSQTPFKLAKNIIKSSERIARFRQQLEFLRLCCIKNIYPPSVNHIPLPSCFHNSRFTKNRNKIKNIVVDTMKRHIYRQIHIHELERSYTMKQLKLQTSQMEYDMIKQARIDSYINSRVFHEIRLANKLKWLDNNLQNRGRNESNPRNVTTTQVITQEDSEPQPIVHSEEITNLVSSGSSIINHANLVTDYTGALTENEIRLLSKGPKFRISQPLNEKTELDIKASFCRLAYQIRWRFTIESMQYTTGGFTTFPKANYINMPRTTPQIDQQLALAYMKLDKIIGKCIKGKKRNNLSSSEKNILKKLKEKPLVCLPSDKGTEFCVIDRDRYITAGKKHLSDEHTYKKITRMSAKTIESKVNKVWKDICKKRNIPKRILRSFITTNSDIPRFYHLIKTHKQNDELKIRPIVSNVNGPTTKVAWLLTFLLKPLLREIPAHLESSAELINRINQLEQNTQERYTYPCSFDVVSLYTSIPSSDAITIVIDKLQFSSFCYNGITPDDLRDLLIVIHQNMYLSFENNIYLQEHGLPMGSSVSGILAILFMDHLENIALKSCRFVGIYGRYVDDVFILTTNKSEAELMLQIFNQQHLNIQFEIEHPNSSNQLSLLDFSITVSDQGNKIYKFYKKPAKKDLFVHYRSAIPTASKMNIIKNERQRINQRCTTFEAKESCNKDLDRILRLNGYPNNIIQRSYNQHYTPHKSMQTPFYFKVPFISDITNAKIRQIFREHNLNVRLYHQETSLRQQLANNTPQRQKCNIHHCSTIEQAICFKRNVVYKITCRRCQNFYIGSTIRFLHIRINEHIHTDKKSSMMAHLKACYNTEASSVQVEILCSDRDHINLRMKEGILIESRQPTINSREELAELRDFILCVNR